MEGAEEDHTEILIIWVVTTWPDDKLVNQQCKEYRLYISATGNDDQWFDMLVDEWRTTNNDGDED